MVTIVQPTASSIVVYVPESESHALAAGMAAILERSTQPGVTMTTKIASIGSSVSELPTYLRTMPQIREWGMPVYLEVTPEMKAVPGEAVRVRIYPDRVR